MLEIFNQLNQYRGSISKLEVEIKQLEKYINSDLSRLRFLREKVSSPSASRFDGMPRNHGYENYHESDIADIVDFESKIKNQEYNLSKQALKLLKLKNTYIFAQVSAYKQCSIIDDSVIHMAVCLHYIDGYSWEETAEIMNDDSIECESIKKRVHRWRSGNQ